MSITLPKFFREFVLHKFPDVKIKFRKNHWFFKYFKYSEDTLWLIGNTIWIDSEEKYNKLANLGHIIPLLAHEYMHLCQNKSNIINWITYRNPQLGNLVFGLPIMLLFFMNFDWLLSVVIGIIWIFSALGPWYSKNRVKMEIEAYKMMMLVEIMQLYPKVPLSNIKRFYKDMPVWIVKTVFSYKYWSTWTPKYIKIMYEEHLELFLSNILQSLSQLDFNKNNSYIIGVPGVYGEVFRYYARSQSPSN